jgi:hypothetical protein
MDRRTANRFSKEPPRRISPGRLRLLGPMLGAVLAVALAISASAAPRGPIMLWTRCSLNVKVAGVEVSPVEVLHLTCAQADHAIIRARVLLTPGGPIFSTRGYTCSSRNILPRVDPSPIELPAAESCTGARHSQLSFIWDYAN